MARGSLQFLPLRNTERFLRVKGSILERKVIGLLCHEILGFVEGSQHGPNNLCATRLGSLRLRVPVQQIFRPVHGHIIFLINQIGKDILQHVRGVCQDQQS